MRESRRREVGRRGRGLGGAWSLGPELPLEPPPTALGGLASLRAMAKLASHDTTGVGPSRPRAQVPVPSPGVRTAPPPDGARKSFRAQSSEWLSGLQSLDTLSCEWHARAGVVGGVRGR